MQVFAQRVDAQPVVLPENTSGYSIVFSQIATGAESVQGGEFAVEGVMNIAVGSGTSQRSSHYSLTNSLEPDSFANTGLATVVDNSLQISWGEEEKPTGAVGYHVYRSLDGSANSYTQIDSEMLTEPDYEDPDLAPGLYYYIVFLVDAHGHSQQWTPAFSKSVGIVRTAAVCDLWMLYK